MGSVDVWRAEDPLGDDGPARGEESRRRTLIVDSVYSAMIGRTEGDFCMYL